MLTFASANPELPVVRVTDNASSAFNGELSVDLDAANELLRDGMGLTVEGITPRYVLYGQSKNAFISGVQRPFSRTAFIQVPSSLTANSDVSTGPMDGLAKSWVHESYHLVEGLEHPTRVLGSLTVRAASAIIPLGLAHLARKGAELPVGMTSFIGLQIARYSFLDESESRAKAAEENDKLLSKFSNIISVKSSASRIIV